MGYSTDYLGHIDIRPALNKAERDYVEAFCRMRHFDRGGSPYDVPGNPSAPDRGDAPIERYNSVAPGKPQLYCQWAVCGTGCCLSFDGTEKFYNGQQWLSYLIEHLFAPNAVASRTDHPDLSGFTFDHRLDGVLVGSRRDTRELFALVVDNNTVERHVLSKGDRDYAMLAPLDYQRALDEVIADRHRRRTDSPAELARLGISRIRAVVRPRETGVA